MLEQLTDQERFQKFDDYIYFGSSYKTSEENGIEVMTVKYVKKGLVAGGSFSGVRNPYAD